MPPFSAPERVTMAQLQEIFARHGSNRWKQPGPAQLKGLHHRLNMPGQPWHLAQHTLHQAQEDYRCFAADLDKVKSEANSLAAMHDSQLRKFKAQMEPNPQTVIYIRDHTNAKDALDALVAAARVVELLPFVRPKQKKSGTPPADWHVFAQALARMMTQALQAAGNKAPSFADVKSPAVKVLRELLFIIEGNYRAAAAIEKACEGMKLDATK